MDNEIARKAYKKLKSSVFYDKTQLILRDAIVQFEINHQNDLDDYLDSIVGALKDDEKFEKLIMPILENISFNVFPKRLYKKNSNGIIDNLVNCQLSINDENDLQFFINLPVEGHILGVMWILTMGYLIDDGIYEHSYGNRIRKKQIREFNTDVTYSPFLFEPYFEQYESWRDKAMLAAEKCLSNNQDVVIITLDFCRYYYSLDVDENVIQQMYNGIENRLQEDDCDLCKKLCSFVAKVIQTYAGAHGNRFHRRNILPIGFLPSNIIANWCLRNFDRAIVDGWNPVYYGRYVDDIIIVDKVNVSNEISLKSKNCELSSDDVIDYFLKKCTRWRVTVSDSCQSSTVSLIQEKEIVNTKNEKVTEYCVNPKYNCIMDNKSQIVLQQEKVKVFYFHTNESSALITCFKENIAKNKSEFRHFPEDDVVFQKDDYSEIYNLQISDTPNKFRGVEGIKLDKYELSKFLGKHLRIGGMITDKGESKFEKDILKIFNFFETIENYTLWEKVIEILIIDERFDALLAFVDRIANAITSISTNAEESSFLVERTKDSLWAHLRSSLLRSFSLVWKKGRYEIQKVIIEKFPEIKLENSSYIVDGYIHSYMFDKSVLPVDIDMVYLDENIDNRNINLSRFRDAFSHLKKEYECQYKYFPYLLSMYDLQLISCLEEIQKDKPFENSEKVQNNQNVRYGKLNYISDVPCTSVKVRMLKNHINQTTIKTNRKSILKIAIANVKINHSSFEKIVNDNSDRSYYRYKELAQVINLAIDQSADMVIMPEAYIPYEWLPILARTCSMNQFAAITGIEHFKLNDRIYNLTATILPFIDNGHRCASITFHLKKHYAPSEIEVINGYGLKAVSGSTYDLFKWRDCYFPVYCCYELASITDRSIFQSYADLLIAVECNRDVKYYSNILESLSRDIHCYCVQVNSSDYGDSRITKPSKSEEKDIIRTKGGTNSCVLVGEVDIVKLRRFQLKEYSLQQNEPEFKSTPPEFNREIVRTKIKGEEICWEPRT